MRFSISDIKKNEDKENKLNLASLTGLNGTFCIFNLDVNIFLNVMSWIKRKSLRTTYAGVFVWLFIRELVIPSFSFPFLPFLTLWFFGISAA